MIMTQSSNKMSMFHWMFDVFLNGKTRLLLINDKHVCCEEHNGTKRTVKKLENQIHMH